MVGGWVGGWVLPDGADEVSHDDEVAPALQEEAHDVPVVAAFRLV